MKHQLAALGGVVALALALLEPGAAAGLKFSGKDMKSEKSLWRLYDRWAKHYNVVRKPSERLHRFAVFNTTVHHVASYPVAGGHTPGLNIFADTSDEEFSRRYICSTTTAPPNLITAQKVKRRNDTLPLPDSIDWRHKTCKGQPCLSPVKDQGPSCGSCWAFAATSAMESYRAISDNYDGNMMLLSEQELVDCDPRSNRCNGGNAANAFRYVRNHGLASSTSYPYTGVNGTCHASTTPRANLTVRGFQAVPRLDIFDEYDLLSALIDGPIVVFIAVGNKTTNNFREYDGGYYPYDCGTKNTHQLLLVGYGPDYYMLKNSWGREWGDQGYLILPRDLDCGMLNSTSYYPLIG